MTVKDVTDFYGRTNAYKARGGEGPCAGCSQLMEPEEPYSVYSLTDTSRTPKKFPADILLCKKCTFIVMGSNLAPPKGETAES